VTLERIFERISGFLYSFLTVSEQKLKIEGKSSLVSNETRKKKVAENLVKFFEDFFAFCFESNRRKSLFRSFTLDLHKIN
jgi:hypothetical protein